MMNKPTFLSTGEWLLPCAVWKEEKPVVKLDVSFEKESFSFDMGKTWTPGKPTGLGDPSARFHISRLASGNLLLVNHYKFTGRNNLTAMISKDDGNTWEGYLTIDERNAVSYPNATQDTDGTIYIVYDRERGGDGAKEILMATLTEADILAGKCISKIAKLKAIVNKAGAK